MQVLVSVQGELETNSYLLEGDKVCYVIDPVENAKETKEYIKSRDLELAGVIITHFHLDHLKAIADFRDSKIYMSTIDYNNITTPNSIYLMRTRFFGPDYMTKNDEEAISHVFKTAKIIKLEDSQQIPFSEKLKVISTPGHTNGSISIYAPSSAALFSGDTLFYHSHGRTDLETASPREMIKTLKNLSTLPLKTTVYPGHGNITSIEEEIKNGVLRRFVDEEA